MSFPAFKYKALTLSYDDNVIYDKQLIEIMERYGLKGTFNVNSGQFGDNTRKLSKDAAISLYKSPNVEVAVHGLQHLALANVSLDAARQDVIENKKDLERIFGGVVRGMAYAYGSYSDEVVELLKDCGIVYARTTVSTEAFDIPTDWLRMPATCHHANPRLMQLAKTFVEAQEDWYFWRKTPMLFYVWGHSYEFNDCNNWEIIEEFAEFMGGREDIWYATNGEIYAYVQAFNRLVFSMEGKIVHNPSAIPVWFVDVNRNNYKIEAGQTLVLQ
jgi:hypothetical protein